MIFPCPQYIDCDKSDIPLAGFNSEAPDAPTFIGTQFGQAYNQPRLGWSYFNPTAIGVYQSELSQEDADAQAQALQMQNLVGCNTDVEGGCWTDENGNPVPVFGNVPYTVPVTCPDGLVFEYTVPAGRYYALDQVTANLIAQSFATSLAYSNQVCLSTLSSTTATNNSPYSATITANGNYEPFTFSIVAGSLPTGISFESLGTVALLTGTPLAPAGTYSFTVLAVDTQGNFMVKSYILTLSGNIWNSLVWNAPHILAPSSMSVAGAAMSGSCSGGGASTGTAFVIGTLTYTGPGGSALLTINLSALSFTGTCATYFFVYIMAGGSVSGNSIITLGAQLAVLFVGEGPASGAAQIPIPALSNSPGTFTLPFTVPAGTNEKIYVYVYTTANWAGTGTAAITASATLQ